MKQSKLVSMIGALVVMISAVAFITACHQANGNKNSTAANNGGNTNTTDNSDGSLEVTPTGKADPALASTKWEDASVDCRLIFATEGNIVSGPNNNDALYTINDLKLSFDSLLWVAIYKNLTLDKHIQIQKALATKEIAAYEKMIDKETDDIKKNALKEELKKQMKGLKELDNLSESEKKDMTETVQEFRKEATALEAHAKFEGTLNAEKTELIIEKCPVYNYEKRKVEVKKVVFKKQ